MWRITVQEMPLRGCGKALSHPLHQAHCAQPYQCTSWLAEPHNWDMSHCCWLGRTVGFPVGMLPSTCTWVCSACAGCSYAIALCGARQGLNNQPHRNRGDSSPHYIKRSHSTTGHDCPCTHNVLFKCLSSNARPLSVRSQWVLLQIPLALAMQHACEANCWAPHRQVCRQGCPPHAHRSFHSPVMT